MFNDINKLNVDENAIAEAEAIFEIEDETVAQFTVTNPTKIGSTVKYQTTGVDE